MGKVKEEQRKCSYCSAEEHELRAIGNFIVQLTQINVEGEVKYACQSCKIKVKEARLAIQKNIGS